MAANLVEIFNNGWARFSRLHIVFRVIGFILAWPVLLGLYIFSRNKNTAVNFVAFFLLLIFLQAPWVASLPGVRDINSSNVSQDILHTDSKKSSDQDTSAPAPNVSPVIEITYGAVTTSCKDYFMTGTLEVVNNGNVQVSGRAEIPVSTYEKFMIPLSGVFLNLPPDSSTVISLEGGEGCKKGQVVGVPSTIFTLPNQNNLETINKLDAFEWSSVKATCDKASAFVRLKATAKNKSDLILTAGIQGYLLNGPLSQGQIDAGVKGTSYFGTIYKLGPGESREIDFGYGDHCLKGRKGFDGPYSATFETRFTY